MNTIIALFLCLTVAVKASGTHKWEWAGLFDLHATSEAGPYTFLASKTTGKTKYAEDSVIMLVVKAPSLYVTFINSTS